MKKVAVAVLLLLVSAMAAQTATYTTTQDACGGKANQACYNIPTIDQNAVAGFISIDNRTGTTVPIQFNFYLGQYGTNGMHGTYAGFVANPNESKDPFDGMAMFVSDDGRVHAQLQFHAYFIKTCSGRGCGGTLGWHYRILMGSQVIAQ